MLDISAMMHLAIVLTFHLVRNTPASHPGLSEIRPAAYYLEHSKEDVGTRVSQSGASGALRVSKDKEDRLITKEYDRRVVALFKGGKATPAQWAELNEAVGAYGEEDSDKLKAIHEGIGYTGQEEVPA